MKKILLACLLCMLAASHSVASDKLKLWMNNPVMVADGKTVTYLTVYQTDEEDEYWNFEVRINLPAGIHIAQRKQGRNMVDDVTLNPDRFDGMPHTIGVNMPDATSFVAICTNMSSKVTYYNDDADGNIVEALFTVGLIADEGMMNGMYDIDITVAKFVRPDVTGHTLTDCAQSKMTITGGVDDINSIIYTLGTSGYGTLILPYEAELPEGVSAYTCTGLDGSTILMQQQATIPACTPVILSGVPGTYTFTGEGTPAEDSYTDGVLTGVFRATVIDEGYVLQQQNGVVGFYYVDAADPKTVPANRCYLNVPASVKMFTFDFETVIADVKAESDSKAYDLSGRPAAPGMRGVVVKSGRKVIVK